jgi:anthranilate synthase/aminodeoxychorismate synthase-like glutamine amidotransferase
LGHQVIGLHFGAEVARSARPWHGKTTRILHSGEGVLRGVPDGFRAARYNSLTLRREQLPPCLEITAADEHGEIMALRHRALRIEGVQFHPESVLSEHGELLLANWLECVADSEHAAPTKKRDDQ